VKKKSVEPGGLEMKPDKKSVFAKERSWNGKKMTQSRESGEVHKQTSRVDLMGSDSKYKDLGAPPILKGKT